MRAVTHVRAGCALLALAGVFLGVSRGQDDGGDGELLDTSGYIEMPASTDGSYVLASPPGSGHNFGKPEFIRFVIMVAREWHRRHPDLPKICVGDMSHRDGSDFPPHKTHKDGLTADIVTRPVNICDIKYENTAHQIELAELFAAMGARQILFNGDAVVQKVKIAQKHELHDDHYHVVADPKKIPDDGKPVLAPVAELAQGATFGGSELDHDGKGLKLAWLLFGSGTDKLKSVHAWFAEHGEQGAVLWDSGAVKPPRDAWLKLGVAVEDGARYRWKLEVELAAGGTASFDWQTIKADLRAPVVSAEGPADGAAIAGAPRLAWKFEKSGAEQASFTIELTDKKNGKPLVAIGPLAGKDAGFLLDATPLVRERATFWRVRARDAHGNEGASEWRSIKPGSAYRFVPLVGKVLVACSIVSRDDGVTIVGKLKKGDEVAIGGEVDTRYLVSPVSGRVTGLVPRAAIDVKHLPADDVR